MDSDAPDSPAPIIIIGAGMAAYSLARELRKRDKAVPLLVERLAHAAPNQFPTYAEDMAAVITPEQKPGFLAVLTQRLGSIMQESKRKRVEKLMAKMNG